MLASGAQRAQVRLQAADLFAEGPSNQDVARRRMMARAHYSLAHEAAREAGDHLQAVAALAHVAFIPAAELRFSAALDYPHGVGQQLRKARPHSPMASWLAAVESEMHTNSAKPVRDRRSTAT